MVFSKFFNDFKNAASSYMNTTTNDDHHEEDNNNIPNDQHEMDGNDGNTFRPMMEAATQRSSNTTTTNITDPNRIEYAFPTCDVCIHERNKIEPTDYYCELALCREHVWKHYLNHNIYDPRSNSIVNRELILKSLENNDLDDDNSDGDDIEIVNVKSLPVSIGQESDDFEHHQLFQVSDSVLDVNNLTEEEEEIINMNGQDFIYWTRLLKTYPHFSTNIIHTPLIIRKLYTNGTLGGSLLIDNRTQHPINVLLSQVGPLHQLLVPPNRLGIFEGIGRVHFTVEVGKMNSNQKLLTTWDRALPIIGTVATGVATGVGIAAGLLTGVGLIGGGAALVLGGGLSSISLATAPVVAGVASVVNNKDKNGNSSNNTIKDNNGSNPKEESSSTGSTNEESTLPTITTERTNPNQDIDHISNGFEMIDIQTKEEKIDTTPKTSNSELSSQTSNIGQVSKWMKKLVPGKSTFSHSTKRGVFCDGHSAIIVTINDDDVRNQNDEDGYFDLELKTF